jgi:hypothetical protein
VKMRFDTVYYQALGVATFCKVCKKPRKRTCRAEQTYNPWNTIEEDGVKRPKTREEIYSECKAKVVQEIRRIETEGIVCKNCETA